MLQGPADWLLTAVMGYLVIDPGKTRQPLKWGMADEGSRWTANLAIRTMQCHVMIWLGISWLGHFAEPMWWFGNGVWWLAAADFSPWLVARSLAKHPYWVNFLSHAFLVIHGLLWLSLLYRSTRPLAALLSIAMALSVFGLAGDWQYAMALIAAMTCFAGSAWREVSTSRGIDH